MNSTEVRNPRRIFEHVVIVDEFEQFAVYKLAL